MKNTYNINFQTYQYTVAKCYITALEYGDYSSLSLSDHEQEDTDLIDAFVNYLPRDSNGRVGSFSWPDGEMDSDDFGFRRCEISGLMADCVEVDYLVAI